MNNIAFNRLRTFRWLAVLLLLIACGCADRNFFRPTLRDQPSPQFSDSGEAMTPDRWWTTFDDPRLNQRMEKAFTNNYSLAAAARRVSAARAIARREASDLLGDVNGVVGFGATFGPGEDSDSLRWGLEGGYPIDLWGEIESRVNAERLRADATNLDYHATALSLSAEIAATWFSLIEANAQLKLLNDQIKTNRTGLEIQESRFGLGLIRSADVLRQRQLLESTLEQSEVATAQIEILEHQMAVLLGEMPQTATYDTGTDLPELPPLPKTGVPSELLNRRPDVRRDYVAFQAADQDLASAISRQYPRLSLSGSLLNIADSPETVLRDWFVSIGGQLIAPLLNGGELRAEVDRSAEVVSQLFNQYAQTTLIALAEVEDNLVREKYQLKRIDHLEKQVTLAGRASDQLREQYLIGDAEYLDVLSAITGQQSLQRRLLSARLELVLIRVTLYRALAGNFDTRPRFDAGQPMVVQDEFDVVLDFDDFVLKQEQEGVTAQKERLLETTENERSD